MRKTANAGLPQTIPRTYGKACISRLSILSFQTLIPTEVLLASAGLQICRVNLEDVKSTLSSTPISFSDSSVKRQDGISLFRKGQYQLTNCSRQSKAWYLPRYKPSRPFERWPAGSIPKKSWQKQQALRLCSSSQGQSPASASFFTNWAVHTFTKCSRGIFYSSLELTLKYSRLFSGNVVVSAPSLPLKFASCVSLLVVTKVQQPGLTWFVSHLLATTFLHSPNYILSKILLFCIFCLLFWLIQKSPYYFIFARNRITQILNY